MGGIMAIIEIFGKGCTKCELLTERATEAAKNLGLEAEIVKVKDMEQIVSRGVMSTPALALDGELKVQGHVPSVKAIEEMLSKA
jgi:small redox-active disulfide protein 2